MLLGLALSACDVAEPTLAPPPNRLDEGWIDDIVRFPDNFTSRVAANRDGWIALHQNDWQAAAAGGGDPAARAHLELAEFYGILAVANAKAWSLLDERWSSRGLSNAAIVTEFRWAAAWTGPLHDALSERLALGAGKERWTIHQQVRNGTLPAAAATSVAKVPVVTEVVDGTERRHHDPWTLATLAIVESQAAANVTPNDLELFSHTLLGSSVDGNAISLPPVAGMADHGEPAVVDADACRDRVRGLDTEIAAWETQLAGSAPTEGRALLDDLRLVDSTRARALVSLAIEALELNRPGCALALSQLALDHESPRAISAVNSPTLFAVTAQAQLALGHSREALDAIEVLVPHYPAVAALDETIGTLVVLDGLDRRGESRE